MGAMFERPMTREQQAAWESTTAGKMENFTRAAMIAFQQAGAEMEKELRPLIRSMSRR